MVYHLRKNEWSNGGGLGTTYISPVMATWLQRTVHGLAFLTHFFNSLTSL